jgi:iron complex outermembrane receptor protein
MRLRRKAFDRGRNGASRSLIRACAIVGFCTAGAVPVAVAAEEIDPFSLSPEQLFDATVSSVSKSDERLRDAAAAIYVLTNEDIMRSGATSIPEVLRLVPGVQVARSNNSSWAISVRGLNSAIANKLLVLIDGREVYDALFSGVYWDIQDTALEDIERIEVIRGPGATLWGANAVNGVINIITKSAAHTQGALVSVVGGNQDRALVTGRFGAAAGDGAHWRVYGKYLDRAAQETLSGADAEDEWRAWRGGFRADWDADAGGDSFTLQGDIYDSRSGKIGSVPQLTAPYSVTVEQSITAQGGNLLGRWNRDLNNGSSLAVQAYVDLTSRQQSALDNDRKVFDAEIQYDLPAWGAHDLIAGAHYRYSNEKLTASPIVTFDEATRRDQLISGFVQDKITLDPARWFLTLGTKVEHNDYSGFEIQPSARLQWLDDGQMAWGSISRAVRTPSLLEHDLDIIAAVLPPGPPLFVPISYELVPSKNFDSEELVAYELGYRRQWAPGLLMDASTFYNDYDKLATYTLVPGHFASPPLHYVVPFVTTNMTRGHTYGFELVFNWRAEDNLNFSAAYGFLEIAMHGPLGAKAAEGQSPQQQFNVRAQWDVSDKLAFDTTLYYVDALPAFGIDAHWRVDTRLGWRVTDALQFEIVGQDLFDDTHREFGAANSPSSTEIERGVYGRLTWRS